MTKKNIYILPTAKATIELEVQKNYLQKICHFKTTLQSNL